MCTCVSLTLKATCALSCDYHRWSCDYQGWSYDYQGWSCDYQGWSVTTIESHVTTIDGHVTTIESHVTTKDGHVTTKDGHMTTKDGHVIDYQGRSQDQQYNLIACATLSNFSCRCFGRPDVLPPRLSLFLGLAPGGTLPRKHSRPCFSPHSTPSPPRPPSSCWPPPSVPGVSCQLL